MRETVRAVIVDKNKRTFLVQHQESNLANLGKWGTPGGGIDKTDLNHEQALTRELSEEFGKELLELTVIGPLLRSHYSTHRADHFYSVLFLGSAILPCAPDEIINSGWFSFSEAKNLNLFFGFEAELAQMADEKFNLSPTNRTFLNLI